MTREGKLQIALLFSLISAANQPSDLVGQALGEADNSTVGSVSIVSQGGGYDFKYPPTVRISKPDAGKDKARLGVRLEPTGRVLAVELVSGGGGYLLEPAVTITPPSKGGRAAVAKAVVAQGRVKELVLLDAGEGYSARDQVQIQIEAPRDETDVVGQGGTLAEATLRLDACVAELRLESGGTGANADRSPAAERPFRRDAIFRVARSGRVVVRPSGPLPLHLVMMALPSPPHLPQSFATTARQPLPLRTAQATAAPSRSK